ncbi:hypothetical protein ACIA49_33850 [Kribbella sp. NPDC051587]|uniref:hypothetical protein n=1 Tax=Kribbella sp. NPDC051587 TaxID=3364119 RepID=UPI0037BB451A
MDHAEQNLESKALMDAIVSAPTGPIIEIKIDGLIDSLQIRSSGVIQDHALALAFASDDLPPIVVDRKTGAVIDGWHRIEAAVINGKQQIRAVYFDGTVEESLILAVQSNVAHGLPLSIADRRTAATRILDVRPDLSDRMIARASGLSARTISAIRECSTAQRPHSNTRTGRDGRVRPLSSAEGRLAAVEVLTKRPEASLRAIAKEAGISVSTARDVRERFVSGQNPVPESQRPRDELGVRRDANAPAGRARKSKESGVEAGEILGSLRADPRLRYNESGRSLLRWLASHAMGGRDWKGLLANISPHSAVLVSRLAREYAANWAQLADELDKQSKNLA